MIKGSKCSDITRLKMHLAKAGHPVSQRQRDKIRIALLGRHASEETRKTISIAQKKRYQRIEEREAASIIQKKRYENPEERAKLASQQANYWARIESHVKFSGPNNHRWRGGIAFQPRGQDWTGDLRAMIRDRDGHLCQNPSCYKPENGRRHPVHHIDYDKNNSNPENLITLCIPCHAKTTDGDREHWTTYLQALQDMRKIGDGPKKCE
jgi:5-methylcytosine-specific restriction endonuclease McrA